MKFEFTRQLLEKELEIDDLEQAIKITEKKIANLKQQIEATRSEMRPITVKAAGELGESGCKLIEYCGELWAINYKAKKRVEEPIQIQFVRLELLKEEDA